MLRILLVLLVFGAAPALAAPRTAPPAPSGVVVHLFGPQGIWANIAPATGVTQPAPAGAAPTPAAPGAVASASVPAPSSTAPAPAPAEQNYQEPTLGAVLDQMFVTGDPNAGPGFAQGRKTD